MEANIIIKNSIKEEWMKAVAEDIIPGITEKLSIVLLNDSVQSFIDNRMDRKTKSTIYIGTFKNSEGAIIGALAHEIAHFLSPPPILIDNFYYKTTLKLTSSRHITNKVNNYIRFLNFSAFRDESKVDKLGIDLLRKAGMNPDYIKEMLKCLLKSANLKAAQKIIIRMRIIKIYLIEV